MDFKSLLKAKLEQSGISQNEAAKMIGCKQAEISNYISGKRKPGVAKITKLALLLELPVESVVNAISVQD